MQSVIYLESTQKRLTRPTILTIPTRLTILTILTRLIQSIYCHYRKCRLSFDRCVTHQDLDHVVIDDDGSLLGWEM